MTREPKTEYLTLSRFFHKKVNKFKSKDLVKDFERSVNLCTIPMDNTNNVKARKESKKKMFDPHFKGFTDKDMKESKIEKDPINLVVAKIEKEEPNDLWEFSKEKIQSPKCVEELHDFFGVSREVKNVSNSEVFSEEKIEYLTSIGDPNDFLGFSKEEIESANKLCDNSIKEIEYLKNNVFNIFRGFLPQEQSESISKLSRILEKCVLIRNEIYKKIDRRILTYHLTEEKFREKVVWSKYWPKQENEVAMESTSQIKKETLKTERRGTDSFFDKNIRRKNDMKRKTVKIEGSRSKEENDCISETFKFKQEPKASRKSPPFPAPSDAPFIQIKKELIVPPFIPPQSPHHLLEEDLYHDPWALLVATIFLNKTAGRTARPYVFWFLEENSEPFIVLGKKIEQLEMYFRALGLQKTRATQVWRMSHDFIYKKWRRVSELYGIGRYGEEAFRMFCLGDFSTEPKDRYLRIYKAWYEMQESGARLKEMNS